MDFKERIKKSVESYIIKNDTSRKKRKNKAPEKEVEKEVMEWLRKKLFSVSVVESKSTYNHLLGRYIGQATKSGTPDVIGSSPEGIAVFLELKAIGKRNRVRKQQEAFLREKIQANSFACVVDSVSYLSKTYETFLAYRSTSLEKAREFLLSELPKIKTKDDDNEPLF